MAKDQKPFPIVLAITGASGIQYAIRLAQVLSKKTELHLIQSKASIKVQQVETDFPLEDLRALATKWYTEDNIMAGPASGSWQHHGMIVCPCSMNTLAAISHGLADNLIHRAADVTLKEKRKLIIVPRETPMSNIHIQNMLTASQAGATILPACPGFYHRPETLDDVIDHLVGRVLDQLHIDHTLYRRWQNAEDQE